jgi:DNA-binding NtrC family response regulator
MNYSQNGSGSSGLDVSGNGDHACVTHAFNPRMMRAPMARKDHVLFVDDNADSVETLRILATQFGVPSQGATTVDDARRAIAELGERLGVLVVDISIPTAIGSETMSGSATDHRKDGGVIVVEAARAASPDLEVIVITGWSAHGGFRVTFPATRVFVKPADPFALFDDIRSAIRRAQLRGDSGA